MNAIETLEIFRLKSVLKMPYTFLCIEKVLAENYFKWLRLKIIKHKENYYLIGKGKLQPVGCENSYEIQVKFSPFLEGIRFENIKIINPKIEFHPKIHMYHNTSLCLYYPKDHFGHVPLFRSLQWTSEWLVKYEFFKRFGVWIGNEVKH
ncbi:hypothetical protein [Chryseobacterium oryctis]|uniref:Type II CBASS E2 protein domain-containing protein n=1 Tax=Chryseobacterium oryctis TaxID=2952618 RepID=A0ABT3HSN3_9FLAO|nr:hypothetical protein [Chryseobacterium oryctis]MCW3162643.1 hypothetical protein [Chryseobacterium oryctis]